MNYKLGIERVLYVVLALTVLFLGFLALVSASEIFTENNPKEVNQYIFGLISSVIFLSSLYPAAWITTTLGTSPESPMRRYFLASSRAHKLLLSILSSWIAIAFGVVSINYFIGTPENYLSCLTGFIGPVVLTGAFVIVLSVSAWVISGFRAR